MNQSSSHKPTEESVDLPQEHDLPGDSAPEQRRKGLDFRKYTQQIWLAGLGAFSRAEEEGTRLFESLVKVGEELESKTTEIVDTTTEAVDEVREKVNERVTGTRNKVEKALDDSITQAFSRLGFASHREINELAAHIKSLTTQVEKLTKDINALQIMLDKK